MEKKYVITTVDPTTKERQAIKEETSLLAAIYFAEGFIRGFCEGYEAQYDIYTQKSRIFLKNKNITLVIE